MCGLMYLLMYCKYSFLKNVLDISLCTSLLSEWQMTYIIAHMVDTSDFVWNFVCWLTLYTKIMKCLKTLEQW